MFVLANFLMALIDLLDWFLKTMILVIFIRVILSWANADPYNGLVRLIHAVTEPFLRPFQKLLPAWRTNGIDFSPLFAGLALVFLRSFLIPTLQEIVIRMR